MASRTTWQVPETAPYDEGLRAGPTASGSVRTRLTVACTQSAEGRDVLVVGCIGVDTVAHLRECLRWLPPRRGMVTTMDLGGVRSCDPAGLRVLEGTALRLRGAGEEVRLRSVAPSIRLLIGATAARRRCRPRPPGPGHRIGAGVP